MMELWMNSSKDGISVSAKYNAENEKECNEVLEKFQQCISWWNCSNAIWSRGTDNNIAKRDIPDDSITPAHIKEKGKVDYEKIRQLNKSMRAVLHGESEDNELSS